MLKHLLAAALTAASVAATPAAHADDPWGSCDFHTAAEPAHAGRYDAVVTGTAQHGEGGVVAQSCYILVNGDVVVSTSYGVRAPGYDVVYGYGGFAATAYDTVTLCSETTTSHGTATSCYDTVLG